MLRRVKLGPQRHPTHSCRSCRPWLLVGQSACRTCCQLQVAGSLDTVPAAAVVASRDEVPGDARTHLVEGPWAAAVAAEDHRRFHRSESTSRCRGTCLVHCRPFNKLVLIQTVPCCCCDSPVVVLTRSKRECSTMFYLLSLPSSFLLLLLIPANMMMRLHLIVDSLFIRITLLST